MSNQKQSQKQKSASNPATGRRRPQRPRPIAASLLTVTLDAKASACVRRFAEEFGEDVRDVASGALLDTLPQALEEWDETKLAREKGGRASCDYWRGTTDRVRDARTRRGGKKSQATGAALPAGPLTLTLVLRGLAQQGYLAMSKSDGKTPQAWLNKTVREEITEFFNYRLSPQHPASFSGLLEIETDDES